MPPIPKRRASHEFILTLRRQAKQLGVNAMDFAKRMLDYGVHAPTTYFPLLVPECLLIEPTETEAKEDLDRFVEVMATIKQEAEHEPIRAQTSASQPAGQTVGRCAGGPGSGSQLCQATPIVLLEVR